MNSLLDPSIPPEALTESIIDSFTKVELKDRRVTRVDLPIKMIHQLTKSALRLHLEPHRQLRGQTLPQDDQWGELWGAKVYVSRDELATVSADDPYFERISERVNLSLNLDSMLRYRIKQNLTIIVKSRVSPLPNITPNEARAIQTLREMITEREYRHYIKYGFIVVKALSGKVYQIFRGRSHTKVYLNGKLIQEMCVLIKDHNIPPTDSVIAFKTIIETDEKEFAAISNVYNIAA